MKRILVVMGLVLACLGASVGRAKAVVDPLVSPNNKIGIHVLDPSELSEAAKLVNGDNGAWGYVTVPIQATDRDRDKWIRFMREAGERKVIPIIRVATVVSGAHWDEPNNFDLVDFANFLNDLPWPTKNRYVVIFNEVNRVDEYGGYVFPEKYANILSNAVTIFKERDEDFFILPAGLDNAAATNGQSLHWQTYWMRVFNQQPDILGRIDGWTSHAYPNPAFSGLPTDRHDRSVASFLHEMRFLSRYTSRVLPVFITETGWDMNVVSPAKAAEYLHISYVGVWSEPRIVAITPFLLRAGAGPFTGFSFYGSDGQPREPYNTWKFLAGKGEPQLNTESISLIKSGGEGESSKPSSQSIWEKLNPVDWEGIWVWIARIFGLAKVRIDPEGKVRVGESEYVIEYSRTEEERRGGLSGRVRLHPDEGMLFVFEEKGRQSFWMKDMSFDIDIVWIVDGEVVEIDQASYKQQYAKYSPDQEVDMVLEVLRDSGIEVGEKIEILE